MRLRHERRGWCSALDVQTCTLDQIRRAHDDMANNRTLGKQVVVL
ncbi:MAG TPA: hypothetical protein VK601_14230 [Kofleriaceae bacterium]|nr:hypothetical protein [Kofleriaceae bacterium]